MSIEAEQLEYSKNNLYRDHYRRTMKWCVLLGITALLLSLLLGYLSVSHEQPKYYATTTQGDVVSLHSLSEPVITQAHMLQWASLAVRAAYNLDDVHYQSQLASAQNAFTPAGWGQFKKSLKQSGLLDDIISKKLMMNAVVTSTPVVLNTSMYKGRYTWRVQMPILVTFSSANEQKKSHYIVTMNIQRVPVVSAPRGIQISDFVAKLNMFGQK